MTPETARFLLDLLGGLTLNVGAPDFDATVDKIRRARAELIPIVAEELPSGP